MLWLTSLEADTQMDTSKLYVCNRHFQEHMFGKNHTLYAYAVPLKRFDRLSNQTALAEGIPILVGTNSNTNEILALPSHMNRPNCARESTVAAPESTSTVRIAMGSAASSGILPCTSNAVLFNSGRGDSETGAVEDSSFSHAIPRNIVDMATQTSASDDVAALIARRAELTRENIRLKEALKRANKKIDEMKASAARAMTIEQFKLACGVFFESPISDFVIAQTSNANYTQPMKDMCLRLYIKSSKSYEAWRKVFRIPTRQCLMNEISNIPCESGLNSSILEAMKANAAAQEDPLKKICTLVFDEMSLQKHLQYSNKMDRIVGYTDFEDDSGEKIVADHALTLMAQGVYDNWKQAIGYYFVSSTWSTDHAVEIILNAVKALIDAGYIPIATISDQGSVNYAACRRLIKSEEEPYFMVNGIKIRYLFDSPHLLKNTRNSLLKSIVKVGNAECTWQHVEQFHAADKLNEPYRDAPKLTSVHIYPNDRQKMKVRYAAEVLSATVGSHMKHYVKEGILDATAEHTAELILKFDKVFDLFNGSLETNLAKPFRTSFKNEPFKVDYLNEMAAFIDTISVIGKDGRNNTNRNRYIRGWQQNFIALQAMWKDLNEKYGITHLPTKNLNQDCIENFFGLMRSSGGDNRAPTCFQFIHQFRRTCCINILNSSNGANCVDDFNVVLLSEMYKAAANNSGGAVVGGDAAVWAVNDQEELTIEDAGKIRCISLYTMKFSIRTRIIALILDAWQKNV